MNQNELDWKKSLYQIASKLNIDALVFSSIVEIESAWNPKAKKYEQSFIYLESPAKYALATGFSLETEKALQRFSYGLCQIMGANCRSIGYGGDLTDLLDPLSNLEWGMKFFKARCCDYVYPKDQAAAWNWGSVKKLTDGSYVNQAYVDRFTAVYEASLKDSGLTQPTSETSKAAT